MVYRTLFIGASAMALVAAAEAAWAAPVDTVSEVVVTADKAGLLERKPSNTVFGLDKPLIDTPRSATFISDTTIQRYGIETINNLVAVSPSSYTASFYGIPGSLNVRGTLADNYFQGFKLIENRGTYTTPIGDAAQIDVVRGPPSAIYGPGKVGGYLNFTPKTAKSTSGPAGEIDATVGSYDKKNLNVQFGAPVKMGPVEGGVYAYGELEDSGSFYEGIHPRRQTGEVSINLDFPKQWSFEADTLIYHSTGDVQTAGWNRLTQDLIDNQTYITGHNTTLSATPGASYLTPNQATYFGGPYPFNFTGVGGGLYAQVYPKPGQVFPPGVGPVPVAAPFVLNSTGAGSTVKLSPRDVYISGQDFSQTFMPTVVLGLSKELANDSTLKLQLFYNGLENKRYVSYGFPAWFRANTTETRLTYDFKLSGFDDLVKANTIVGVSYRSYQGRDMQSFNSGLIALDRRDLSVGARPTDSMCDPFTVGISNDQFPANCQGWELAIKSTESDAGVFGTTDIMIGPRLDVIVGGRHDDYHVRSTDTGILSFDAPKAAGSKGDDTYSASVSYKVGWGFMPYFTYAEAASLEVQQAGDLKPADIASGGWLSRSDLNEGGVKFQLLNKTLVGSVDAYRQERTQLSGLNSVSLKTRSTGVEFEVRYLATENLSFTLSGDSQHTEVIGPDTSTVYVPAYSVCGATLACELSSWGGSYLAFNFSSLPGRAGNYSLSSIPHSVVSFYANYITDEHSWGKAGVTAGFTHVTKTSGTLQNAIVYPGYYIANASVFYKRGTYEADLNVDNLFDKLYLTPNSDPTYVNMSAIPSIGREWRITLKKTF
jgi:iron complex outermembrane receptor protein